MFINTNIFDKIFYDMYYCSESRGNTRLDLAIQNTYQWMNEERNPNATKRYMIILTDGATSSPEETKNMYEMLKQSDITPLTIYIENHTLPERLNFDLLFSKFCYYTAGTDYIGPKPVWDRSDMSKIVDSLGTTTYEYLTGEADVSNETEQTTSLLKEYQYSSSTSSAAQDNSARRNIVDDYSIPVTYKNGVELRKLEDGANTQTNVDQDNEYYKKVADNTYMEASAYVTFNTLNTNISGVNLILTERPKNEVKVEKSISKIKVYLADGSVLIDWSKDNGGNITKMGTTYLLDLGEGKQKLITMDSEIMHGATIKITYQIEVKNMNNNYENKYVIYDYIDTANFGFSVDEPGNAGWTAVDLNNSEMAQDIKDGGRIIVKTDEITDQNPTKEITLTRVITQMDQGRYENWCEIAEYSNEKGRRIYYTTPANCNPDANPPTMECDTAQSPLVGISPPFGKED